MRTSRTGRGVGDDGLREVQQAAIKVAAEFVGQEVWLEVNEAAPAVRRCCGRPVHGTVEGFYVEGRQGWLSTRPCHGLYLEDLEWGWITSVEPVGPPAPAAVRDGAMVIANDWFGRYVEFIVASASVEHMVTVLVSGFAVEGEALFVTCRSLPDRCRRSECFSIDVRSIQSWGFAELVSCDLHDRYGDVDDLDDGVDECPSCGWCGS